MTANKWTALALVCLLPLSCERNVTPPTSDTAVATSTSTSTSALDTGGGASGQSPGLATRSEKPAGKLFARTIAPDLRVEFHGVIAHVLGLGVTRAVVPDVPGHDPQIQFPISLKTEIEKAFPGACSSGLCLVDLKGVAFRVVDKKGKAPAVQISSHFSTVVTHLKDVPAPEKPFEDALINPDVYAGTIKSGSVVVAFFELAGGRLEAFEFSCPAKFDGEPKEYAFPSSVIADFDTPSGTTLEYMTAKTPKWMPLVLLTPGLSLAFIVDNDLPGANSHFNAYSLLSTKRDSLGKPIKLPDVKTTSSNCTRGHGDVPGCSNSAWP